MRFIPAFALAAFALTACEPDMEYLAEEGLLTLTYSGSTTQKPPTCTKTNCDGKVPQQITAGGGAPTIVPNPMSLKGHSGTLYLAGTNKRFGIGTYAAAQAYAQNGAEQVGLIAAFNDLPSGALITGVYKANMVADVPNTKAAQKDEILVEINGIIMIQSVGSGIVSGTEYDMDYTPPSGGGGGGCGPLGC